MRPLTLEREVGDQWLVNSGVKAGDRVVVEGVQTLQMLRPGTPVTVKPAFSVATGAGAAPAAGAPAQNAAAK